MKRMKGIFVATFVILVLQAVPVPAQVLATSTPNLSATERDPRWLPWLGCWQLKEEQFERPAFAYFDYTIWLRSKIEGKSMLELSSEKK